MKFESLPHFCSIKFQSSCRLSQPPITNVSSKGGVVSVHCRSPSPAPPIARYALTMKAYSTEPDFFFQRRDWGFPASGFHERSVRICDFTNWVIFIKAYFFGLVVACTTSLAIATICVLGKMRLSQAISCNSYLPECTGCIFSALLLEICSHSSMDLVLRCLVPSHPTHSNLMFMLQS